MAARNELASAWDNHARTYARLGSPFTGYIAQSLFHTVAARLPPGPRILDIACGNGELSAAAVLHCLAEREVSGRPGVAVASFLALSGGPDRALRLEASCHFAVARVNRI